MKRTDYRAEPLQVALRKKRELNVSQVCAELGISRQAFYAVINATAPYVTAELLAKIAGALEVNLQDVILQPTNKVEISLSQA